MTSTDIELALVKYFNPRQNLIIPNVSWGWADYECDLLLISQSGYATEIEIKVSKADIQRDLKKRHMHDDNKIKRLIFAIPDSLSDCADLMPSKAGIILVRKSGICTMTRSGTTNKIARSITDKDRYDLARLGAMRIWTLKAKLNKLRQRKIEG